MPPRASNANVYSMLATLKRETATVASSNYMHPDGLLPLLKDDCRILCEKCFRAAIADAHKFHF